MVLPGVEPPTASKQLAVQLLVKPPTAGLFPAARLSLKHKIVLKSIPRGETRVDVEELWQEEAI